MIPSTAVSVSPLFEWPVPMGGYRMKTFEIPKWARTPTGYEVHYEEHGTLREIIRHQHGTRLIVPVGTTFDSRRPTEQDSALHMNFAQLPCTEDAVLGFAAQYGLLHQGDYLVARDDEEGDDGDGGGWPHPNGESLDQWFDAIERMRLAITLWQASSARSDSHIRQLAKSPPTLSASQELREARVRKYQLEPTEDCDGWIVYDQFHIANLRQLQSRQQAQEIAHAIVLEEWNSQFGTTHPRWSFQMVTEGRFVLQIAPYSLVGLMWLQLGCAITSDAQFRTCEYCGRFFDASGTRKTRKYCVGTDSCKTRAYLRRKSADQERRGQPGKKTRTR